MPTAGSLTPWSLLWLRQHRAAKSAALLRQCARVAVEPPRRQSLGPNRAKSPPSIRPGPTSADCTPMWTTSISKVVPEVVLSCWGSSDVNQGSEMQVLS
jgi:hypothetical protein